MADASRLIAVHGDFAPETLSLAGLSDCRVLYEPDDLSCGPLRAFHGLAEWRAERKASWADMIECFEENDPSWTLDVLSGSSELIVLAGTGLADQLFLTWFLQVARHAGLSGDAIRLAQLESNPTRRAVTRSDSVPADVVAACLAHARRLTVAEINEIDTAWRAVVAPEPTALFRLVDQPELHLPCLRMLGLFRDRYPDTASGFSRFEHVLAEKTQQHGPAAPRIIGYSMQEILDGGDSVGDLWLFDRLRRMGLPAHPCPAVELSKKPAKGLGGCEVSLTEHGRRFLAGERNFVEENGIDDWVGGVHLDSQRGPVWFRDRMALVQR